ncbi:hypothetical protein FBZ99_10751 [Rhizobium sp. ERR 1071]|nr:hypothetical protein FBZ99_10751 [Rhizobium sp. ERR1071]
MKSLYCASLSNTAREPAASKGGDSHHTIVAAASGSCNVGRFLAFSGCFLLMDVPYLPL